MCTPGAYIAQLIHKRKIRRLPSVVRSLKKAMMSDVKYDGSTVAANFPRFNAADLRTMGMSS
jgi:hypothetical protein